jgi:hypothetical protein
MQPEAQVNHEQGKQRAENTWTAEEMPGTSTGCREEDGVEE